MARGSQSETPPFQAGDHAARDGNCDCKRALRARRRVARRDQALASEEALRLLLPLRKIASEDQFLEGISECCSRLAVSRRPVVVAPLAALRHSAVATAIK